MISLSGNLNEVVSPSARDIQQNEKYAPQAQVCPGGDCTLSSVQLNMSLEMSYLICRRQVVQE